jgi:hypothetical protein
MIYTRFISYLTQRVAAVLLKKMRTNRTVLKNWWKIGKFKFRNSALLAHWFYLRNFTRWRKFFDILLETLGAIIQRKNFKIGWKINFICEISEFSMHFTKKDFPKEFIGKILQNQINNKLSMYTNQKHTFLHLCRAAIPQININLPSVL